MKKEYRLIQIIDSWDETINESVVIFELTLIEYNYNKTGYHFKPRPDVQNDFYVFLSSENDVKYLESLKEDVIEMRFEDFEFNFVKTPEGLRRTYFSNRLFALRNKAKGY